jgi:hypothetical protein
MVAVQPLDDPALVLGSRRCERGAILKVVATNICGSDQHMVRGRTTAPVRLVLGHEADRARASQTGHAAALSLLRRGILIEHNLA